jgi:hypothetical protein
VPRSQTQTSASTNYACKQELSNLLWACAKTQHTAKLLFSEAEGRAREVLACMHAARRGAGAGAVGGGAAAAAEEEEDEGMVPLEVSDEMWRFALVGQCADQMFEKLESELLLRDLTVSRLDAP